MINKIFNKYFELLKIYFSEIIKNKKNLLLMLLILIIFIIVIFFIYNKFIKTFINKDHVLNKEFINKDNDNNIVILFFYTEWCPYCKQALPEINKFEDYILGLNEEKNHNILLTKIDCDKNTTLADKYKIEGYPSIKLIYKGDIYNYDAKPNKDNLIKFLNSTTNI